MVAPASVCSEAALGSLGRVAARQPVRPRPRRHLLRRAGEPPAQPLSRLQHEQEAGAWAARRVAEGKTLRERFVARRRFRLLERSAQAD